MRYALRRLLHEPGFSAIVVLTLALGIGANTAIFSIVNGVLLKPQPYPEPERVVVLNHYYGSLDGLMAGFAVPSYRDFQERTQMFDAFAVANGWNANLTGIGEPERLVGQRVTGEYFAVFRSQAAMGRVIEPGEDTAGRDRVAVLSHGLWVRRFGADPSVLGSKVVFNGEPFDVIGIMPAGFRDFFDDDTEVWAPLVFTPEQYSDDRRTSEFLSAAGRLKEGMTFDQAQRDITAFAEQLKRDYPDAYAPTWTINTRSLAEVATGRIRPALLVLLGAVGLVLLIACANIANLLLARAASRTREIAVRAAIGATRVHLIRQLLAESVTLALVGAALGLVIAYGAVQALIALTPPNLLRADTVQIDTTVLLFTLAVALVTGVLFGVAPALHASRADLQHSLKDGARGAGEVHGRWLRKMLVVTEIALALILLVNAALLLRSFARIQNVDPGFDPSHVMTMSVSLPDAKYDTPEKRVAFFEQLLPRVRNLPGVVEAGATTNIPFGSNWSTGSFTVEGYQPPEGQPSPWGDLRLVTPGFFEAMKVSLVKGRYFTDADREGSVPVVIVDREQVRRYWPDTDPIGKRVTFGDPDEGEVEWITVVGVVDHTAHEGLDAERRVQLYFPYAMNPRPQMTLAIRTAADPAAIVNQVRDAVRSVDPDQPISQVFALEALMDRALGQRRLLMYLLLTFALLALVLSAVGIYGVMSFDVTRRSQEMGLRMALGAARGSVLALVLRQGLMLALLGILLGLTGAFALTRVIEAQLFDVAPRDPATFVLVAAVLAVVAAAATLIPALRATRVDPVEALRYE
jgi:putative ABC transport system permease protein